MCDLALSGLADPAPFLAWAEGAVHVPRTVRVGWQGAPEPLVGLISALVGRGAEVELLLTDPTEDLEPLYQAVKPLVGIPAIFLEVAAEHLEAPALERNLRIGAQMALPMNLRLRLSEPGLAARAVSLSENAGGKRTIFWRDCGPGPAAEPEWLEGVDRLATEGYRVAVEGCVPACAHPRLRGRGCAGGLTAVRIDREGRVFPCSGAAEPVGSLGAERLEEIWRSAGMEAWRSRADPRCAGCALHPSCGSAGKGRPDADPLLRGPEVLPRLSAERWEAIDRAARPYLTARREGTRGAEIVYDSRNFRHLVLVDRRHDDLLDRLNGLHTREELESRFGEDGRELLQRLYLERLVGFLPPALRA